MQTISWGIIGCGNVTEIKSGPAFNKVPGSALVAVMRRNAEKAKDYAIRHGVPSWYSDAGALIEDPKVNAIYIATPPLQHVEYAIAALRKGKPVYIEKPMAVHSSAARQIADIVRDTGIKASIAHYRRQQPLFLKIKSLLKSGAIGDIHQVNLKFFQPHLSPRMASSEENWRINPVISGGGLFHDLAPHQLDLMVYFFGKAINVNGISINKGGYYEPEDTITGHVLFENDVVFSGAWGFAEVFKEDRCEILGSHGIIRFSVFEHHPVELITKEKTEYFEFEPLVHVQQPMIEKVTGYFLGNGDNPCSAEEGVEVMKIIDAITGRGDGKFKAFE